jgi:hypothetical protein
VAFREVRVAAGARHTDTCGPTSRIRRPRQQRAREAKQKQETEGAGGLGLGALTKSRSRELAGHVWADENGLTPLHKTMFGKTLAQKWSEKVARSSGSAWKGLKLKPTLMASLLQKNGLMPAAE